MRYVIKATLAEVDGFCVTRTITDLDQSKSIRPMHPNEAIDYQTLDRHLWT